MALTTIALFSTIAGAGLSAYGSIQAGKAQQQQSEYNAKVAENNAIAQSQETDYQIDRLRENQKRSQSAQLAAIGKSGLSVEGSFEDVINDSNISQDLDALALQYRGNTAVNRFSAQAELQRATGKNARSESKFGAVSSILSGTTSAVTTKLKFD